MNKYNDDEKVCLTCVYFDETSDISSCTNPKGAGYMYKNYHVGDTGCDKWKPDRSYSEMIREEKAKEKPTYGNGYIENAWSEWEKKAYRKGLIHE